jgi:hypothetical protein
MSVSVSIPSESAQYVQHRFAEVAPKTDQSGQLETKLKESAESQDGISVTGKKGSGSPLYKADPLNQINQIDQFDPVEQANQAETPKAVEQKPPSTAKEQYRSSLDVMA